MTSSERRAMSGSSMRRFQLVLGLIVVLMVDLLTDSELWGLTTAIFLWFLYLVIVSAGPMFAEHMLEYLKEHPEESKNLKKEIRQILGT